MKKSDFQQQYGLTDSEMDSIQTILEHTGGELMSIKHIPFRNGKPIPFSERIMQ
jgi:hypothetical protein